METPAKQTLYKTAYSPLFSCYVAIDSARQDDRGDWIFTCHNTTWIGWHHGKTLNNHLFRECELNNFCL